MLLPKFYVEKVEQRAPAATYSENDPPVWVDQDRVAITIPGDREEVVIQIVTKDLLNRWRNGVNGERSDAAHQKLAEQYDRWKAGQLEPDVGTPLELSGLFSPAVIENLKAPPRHCRTVEQLADMSDAQGQGIPMFMASRVKAQKFLEAKNGPAALAGRMTEQDATIATQASQIADLSAQVAALLKGGIAVPGASIQAHDGSVKATAVMPADDDLGPPVAGAVPADAAVAARAKRARIRAEDEEAA